MPFRSAKQRAYLYANEPELARRWTRKYGSGIKRSSVMQKKAGK